MQEKLYLELFITYLSVVGDNLYQKIARKFISLCSIRVNTVSPNNNGHSILRNKLLNKKICITFPPNLAAP